MRPTEASARKEEVKIKANSFGRGRGNGMEFASKLVELLGGRREFKTTLSYEF